MSNKEEAALSARVMAGYYGADWETGALNEWPPPEAGRHLPPGPPGGDAGGRGAAAQKSVHLCSAGYDATLTTWKLTQKEGPILRATPVGGIHLFDVLTDLSRNIEKMVGWALGGEGARLNKFL